jgi:enoyl-CoA hydratase
MQRSASVEFEIDATGLASACLAREHGNAINEDLACGLIEACEAAAADRNVRGMRLCATGKLFCPGLDLQELIELDRPAMEGFLERFGECLLALYTFPKPLLAEIHGHAIAGGCVLAMTADWRVLGCDKMLGLAELRVGLPFPYGVALILRDAVPAARIAEVVLLGRNYIGQEAVSVGLAHEVHGAEGFEEHCRSRLEELADRDLDAFGTTKRYLREQVVERIRAEGQARAGEFLDAWFSDNTRERIRAVVAELQKKGE